jgi:hypothetical protein
VAGDTFRMSFILKDSSGSLINFNGYTGAWQVRVRPETSTTIASSTGGTPNATLTFATPHPTGKIDIATNALTVAGLYYYDVEVTSANGDRTTFVMGHIRVVPEVTR